MIHIDKAINNLIKYISWVCVKCGATNSDKSTHCHVCGHKAS